MRKRKNDMDFITMVLMLLVALAIFVPPLLAIIIPIAVIWGIVWICISISTSKQKKKTQQMLNETLSYLAELDTMESSAFKESTRMLIKCANAEGYKLNGYITSGLQDVVMMFYQSVDNVGIAPIRTAYGNKVLVNSVLITNRHLTYKAKEFCKNGMIIVVDRDVLSDICVFLLEKGYDLLTLQKKETNK